MAVKDVAKGWGALPGSHKDWRCPVCKDNFPVSDWPIVFGASMDGRKCPKCDFAAYQQHETEAMRPVYVEADWADALAEDSMRPKLVRPKKVAKPKKAAKVKK